MNKKDSGAVVDRLQAVFGAKDDTELSYAMGQKRSTVGNWRNRGTIPYTECVRVAEVRGVSLDWLLTGEGPMFRGEARGAGDDHVVIQAPTREPDMPELLGQLADSARRENDRLTAIEKQLQELQAAVAALTRSP